MNQKNISLGGDVNKPVNRENFEELLAVAKEQLSNSDLYVTDVFCGFK